MTDLPVPKEMTFVLQAPGVAHVSPYTGSVVSYVNFGTRKLWRVVYDYGIISLSEFKQIQAIVKNAGNAVVLIRLFYQHRQDVPAIASTKSEIITQVDGSELSLDQSYSFIPGDILQVGNYALLINSRNGADIVVDNIPAGFSDLPDETAVTTHPYYFRGRNIEPGFEGVQISKKNVQTRPLILGEVI